MQTEITRTFWIGVIIVSTIFVFIGGVFYLQEINLTQSNYSFTVLFDNVQGLYEGDNVNMFGKRVGKVVSTKIKNQRIAVELSIDNNFAFSIPVDSKFEVKSEGFLGTKYVSITPGINNDKYITSGQTVEGFREYDFSEITPDIVPMTQDLAAFARRLKATLGEEEKDNIRKTIMNIESISSNFDTLVGSLGPEESNKISQSIDDLAKIVELIKNDFEEDEKKITEVISDLKSLSDKFQDLEETIVDLNQISSNLNNGKGSLGKLLYNESLYNNMDSLIIDLRLIVNEFQNNPSKYFKAIFKSRK